MRFVEPEVDLADLFLLEAVHESLAQRIVMRHHLSGVTHEVVPEYLCHRLRLAGCEVPLFEPAAMEALF